MLTRKYYKAIAEIIKDNSQQDFSGCYENIDNETAHKVGLWVANQLADYFEQDNPQFDRKKFLRACGTK